MNPFARKTYGESLAHIADRHGTREALVFEGRRWSFRGVKDEVDRASGRLWALGLRPGAKVAIWMPNRPEFLWYWLGAMQIGLVAVLLNTRLRPGEAAYQIDQSDSQAVMIPGDRASRDFVGDLHAIRAQLPKLAHILALDPLPDPIVGVTDWSGRPPECPPPPLESDPESPALIAYSSGTTGLPKGAALGHWGFRKAWDHGSRFNQTADDKLYLCVPLYGILANVNGVLTFWSRGSSVVLAERFEPTEALRTLEDEGCTACYVLPVMLERMLAHPHFKTFDLSRLRTGIVVGTDAQSQRRAALELGMRELVTSYGMTETTSAVTRTRSDDPFEVRMQCQGKPLPGIEVRIADADTDAPLPTETSGEIQVRGYCVMQGYYNKPEETHFSFTADGWFKTGDRGTERPDGNFVFHSRLKDGYKFNGFNVSTEEVESRLLEHPSVRQAAVVGLPDHRHGEIGIAFLVATDSSLTPDAVLEFVRPKLASYKLPRYLFLVDDLPLTSGTEKVQKFKLRAMAETLLSCGTNLDGAPIKPA